MLRRSPIGLFRKTSAMLPIRKPWVPSRALEQLPKKASVANPVAGIARALSHVTLCPRWFSTTAPRCTS